MDSQAHSDKDVSGESGDSPPSGHAGDVLRGACLICGGDLVGRRGHHFVCTACNLRFSEENLVRAGKLRPRKRAPHGSAGPGGDGRTYYEREVSRDR